MPIESQTDESRWAEELLTLQRRLGELERQVAVLRGFGGEVVSAAPGFLARSAFTRWQGLGLLVLTILKVFLYDVSGLSAGYRVASFLGLGVLLLAVSFAYQKNWLGLRETGVGESTAGER